MVGKFTCAYICLNYVGTKKQDASYPNPVKLCGSDQFRIRNDGLLNTDAFSFNCLSVLYYTVFTKAIYIYCIYTYIYVYILRNCILYVCQEVDVACKPGPGEAKKKNLRNMY